MITDDPEIEPVIRSVVALDAQGKPLDLYTGFLCHLDGEHMWCTAAHVLEEADKLAEHPSVARWGLVAMKTEPEYVVDFDYPGSERTSIPHLARAALENSDLLNPLALENVRALEEVDFACLWLRSPLYFQSLINIGARPLTEGNLITPSDLRQDSQVRPLQCFVIGLPASGWEPRQAESPITLKMLEVRPRTIIGPIYEFEPAWDDDLHKGHVRGMSGGPVVAFALDKPIVIGVQSAQFGNDNRVSYLKVAQSDVVFDILREAIREYHDLLAESGSDSEIGSS